MARFAFSLIVLAMSLAVSNAAPLPKTKRALPTPVSVSTAKTYLSGCGAISLVVVHGECNITGSSGLIGGFFVLSDCGDGFEFSGVCA